MRETFEDMPLSLKHFLLKRTFGLDLRLVVFFKHSESDKKSASECVDSLEDYKPFSSQGFISLSDSGEDNLQDIHMVFF